MREPKLETQSMSRCATTPSRRQLTILFVDMVGYSKAVEQNEIATLDFMSRSFDTLRVLTRRFDCTLVKTTGDGALVTFDRPAEAVAYAVEFQKITTKTQTGIDDPFSFRTGIHMGEVVLRNGDIFGTAVNIASRLQGIAPPGGCIVSQAVYEDVRSKSDFEFVSIGAPTLKNIAERMQAYQLRSRQVDFVDPLRQSLLVLQLIGAPRLVFRDSSSALATGAALSQLLAYLALTPEYYATHESLLEILWPDRPPENGRRALRQTISSLRRVLKPAPGTILQGKGWIALNPTAFETDLEGIEADLRRGRIARLLLEDETWPDRILTGLAGVGPPLEAWIRVKRNAWRRRVLDQLERILDREPAASDMFLEAADAILLLEPGNEVASYARIAHALERGNRPGAMEEYHRLERYLSVEFGMGPSERVRAAIRAARRGNPPRGGPFSQENDDKPRRRLLRIAVRSFEAGNTGGNRVSAFQSELVANLARIRDWAILDGLPDGADIHEADYDISGSALAAGPDVMLSLRLHSLPDSRVLWSNRVSLTSQNWAEIQHQALCRIIAELESYISTDRLSAVLGPAGSEPTTHDAWLRGDMAMMRWSPEGFEEAAQIFLGILEKEPDHVPSLTNLASMTNIRHLIWPGMRRDADEIRDADERARHAAEIDPMDARAHRVVAWTAAYAGAFERALLHVDRAAELNPNSVVVLASCALGYAWFGEREKADAAVTRLMAITRNLPPWLWSYLCVIYYFLDRLDDAQRAAELSEDKLVDTQGWIAAIAARRGDTKAAVSAFGLLIENVKPVWKGAEPLSTQAVVDWFTTAFPIRTEANRDKLALPIFETARRV